mgnify:CR=1 FL=1
MTERIAQNPHALGIIAALEAEGLDVGDGIAPHDVTSTDDEAWTPYVVLYMLPGGDVDGTAGSPDSDGDLRFQLTSVGRTAAEARHVNDRAAQAFRDNPVEVPGRSVQRVRPLEATNAVRRDDDVQPPLFFVVARYGAWTFPA